MNKFLGSFFCLLMVFTVRGRERPLVVATTSIFADMADNLGGGLVEVKTLVPRNTDPYQFVPSSAHIRLVEEADVILMNGLSLEGWWEELLANAEIRAEVVLLSESIMPIPRSSHGNAIDPYAWMTATNGIMYIEQIAEALIRLLPQDEEAFRFNFGIYRAQLLDLDQYIQEQIHNIPPENRVLITYHDAFRYFGEKYGLRVESIAGVATNTSTKLPSISTLEKKIKQLRVPVLFIENPADSQELETLARKHRIEIGGPLFSGALGDEGSLASTYLDMLRYNVDTIVAILAKLPTAEEKQMMRGRKLPVLLLSAMLVGVLIYLYRARRKGND